MGVICKEVMGRVCSVSECFVLMRFSLGWEGIENIGDEN